MHKFRFGSGNSKNLIVSVGMAAIMAVPALGQPLGLALASTGPVNDALKVQTAVLSQVETNTLAPEGSIEDIGFAFTRYEASRDVALTLATPVTSVSPYTVYITRDAVNYRTQPSTSSAVIRVLNTNDVLYVTGVTTDWLRVTDSVGHVGYVWADYLSRNMVFTSTSDTVYLLKSNVNLRQAPTTDSAVLNVLSAGTRLTRTGIGAGWTRVRTASGTTGYIASEFLGTTAPATVSSLSPAIDKVVDTAYSMLGVPYVWASEDRSGVDCSGLTYYCYKQIGVTLPRTSYYQAKAGTAVSYSNMKPGDIIAMDTANDGVTKVTHVGLYVGDGYMIHASSSNGKVVKANVANYLKYEKLVTIRRIVN